MSKLRVPTVKEMIANNERPEILFWVGCAGSFDDRAKKISKAIVKILNYCNINLLFLDLKNPVQEILLKELEMNLLL